MKRKIYQFKKVLGGFVLGTILITNFNGNVFANNATFMLISNGKELPKPKFQNQMGTFAVDFSILDVNKETLTSDLNAYFNLDENNSFKLEREYNDELGNTFYNYQHYYNDLKVEGDIVFIQIKNNKVQYVGGQLIPIKDLNTGSSLSHDQVKQKAYEYFGTTENVTESEIVQVLTKVESKDKVEVKSVFSINLYSSIPVKSLQIFVDTENGEVVKAYNTIYHADAPSNSATRNRGTQAITVDSYNGGYRLKDNARNIHTRNGAGWDGSGNTQTGEFTGNITEYTSTTANFTGEATKPAVEVHWGMTKSYDYYKNRHNRLSYDGNSSIIRNYYLGSSTNPGLNSLQANAGAIDQGGVVGMVYGNGKTQLSPGGPMEQVFNPLVSLDVAGHEFSHLIISRNGTGGLNYLNEAGALNESFADMFGAAIEFYTNLNPNWTIGEGLINMSNVISPNYMRSMSNPNSGPAALSSQQPDTYHGTYWKQILPAGQQGDQFNDFGGVHTNSGVGNYWFYLLSVGGSGTNDNNDAYSVTGITIQKAEKIAYKALTTFLTPTSTYMDARYATLQAASILYGQTSNEVTQVARAWYAVGLGEQTASTQNVEMESKLTVYPNPATGDEVYIDSALEDATTVEMYDLSGKKVMSALNLDYKTTINVANYASGMYILKFKSNLGEYSHKLMIK